MSQKQSEKVRNEGSPASDELTDDQLEGVAGGAGYLKLGDIKGESTDKDHKGWSTL